MGRRTYRVTWAQAASRDLTEIPTYIAGDSPVNARRVLKRLKDKASRLAVAPARGRVVPELARFGIRSFRELIVRPHRLMYRIVDDRVLALAVFDGRRDLEEVLLERLVR